VGPGGPVLSASAALREGGAEGPAISATARPENRRSGTYVLYPDGSAPARENRPRM
jgi:hypothetical protein